MKRFGVPGRLGRQCGNLTLGEGFNDHLLVLDYP